LKEFNAAFALYTKPIKIVAQRAAQVGEIRRPLALAFVDRCLLMQTVRIGAAIAFDVVSTLNGNDERLPELELRRQQQYTHIYNKTQSTMHERSLHQHSRWQIRQSAVSRRVAR
jgi:hypothetical protein